MIDCLILGFSDSNFEGYVEMVKGMGEDSGGYRDLNLAFIDYEGKPQRALDILTRFYYEDKGEVEKPFHNADFLWPVVAYLGTYLSRRGLKFDYVNLPHIERDKLREKLLEEEILTIAITTTLYVSMHPILELISFIKQYNETAKIIVGGPFISNQPKLGDQIALQRTFKYIGADFYVISSEGETALVNLVNALKTNSSLDKIDNIAYKSGSKYKMTATSIESNPLEENMVDYSLFPREDIDQFVTTRTAKSCPFSCSFCGFPQRAGKYKYVGVELVEKELNAIRDIGTVTTITFIDDTFNVPKERFKEILRMMIRNNYGFKWNSFYRCDHGDDETIELMGKAGCEGVFLGVESGSDAMLKAMNKTARQKDYLRSIPLLRDAGISTHANIIVGFPGETYDTVQESVDLIERAKPDYYRAQLWYADPVTPIWDKKEYYGVKGSMFNWSHNTMDCHTASDLVEKMFVCVEGSVWLPQNGFEQWSTFYLQRRGMSVEQIKNFVTCFNSVIKEKLVYPDKKETSPELIENLKRSSRYDVQAEPYPRPIEIYSGASYNDAERFWMKEFGGRASSSNIEAIREAVKGKGEETSRVACVVDETVLDRARSSCRASLSELMLAAFCATLSRLNDQEEITVVADLGGSIGVIPLKLYPTWNLSFEDFLNQVRQKIQQASGHGLYALHILANRYRMAEKGLTPPVFDLGFVCRESNGERSHKGLEEVLNSYPSIKESMGLMLRASAVEGDPTLQLIYAEKWFRQEIIEKLGVYLVSLVEQVAAEPGVCLADIALASRKDQSSPVNTHINETFTF